MASEFYDTASSLVELDCRDVKKIFLKLKERGICKKSQKFELYEEKVDENLLNSNHFMDKIHYYRVKKRVTKVDMARAVGIDDTSYGLIECKKYQLSNVEYAEKFIKRLNIEDELELPDYYKFMKEYPTFKVVEFIKENFRSATEFSKFCNVSPATIQSWINNSKLNISLKSYQNLLECWKKYFNYHVS